MRYVLLLTVLSIGVPSYAQDTLIFVNGNQTIGHITEMDQYTISLQSPDTIQNELRVILRSDVFMIKHASGLREVITTFEQVEEPPTISDPQHMYNLGMTDAKTYFTGKKAMGLTMVSLLYPPLGGAVILYYMTMKAEPRYFINHDHTLLNNKDYVEGYQKVATKMRRKRSLQGLGIMAGTVGVIFIGAVAIAASL